MKEFFRLLRRFVPPYKKYLIWALFLNLLSAILNIFSFALIIPILQILFKMDTKTYEFIPWDAAGINMKDIAVNNFYYYVTEMIASQGGSLTLLILGVFLAVMTLLKAFSYFASSAVMIPLRTGVVRDIRAQVYNKVLHLPLSFFSEERKGDIIARMSGDVTEVETSVTSSLDMLIKNPILFRYIDSHQLAADAVHAAGASGHGLGNGHGRQETETAVAGCAGKVERYHVAVGRNPGRVTYHQSLHCRKQDDGAFQ